MKSAGVCAEIVIADFGSQYTFLIAKTIRKIGYFCEIVDPLSIKAQNIKERNIKLLILSGGPQSVYENESINSNYINTITEIGPLILDPDICVLGICYGMQYICHFLNGKVEKGKNGEYGKAELMLNPKYKKEPFIQWIFEHMEKHYAKTIKPSR